MRKGWIFGVLALVLILIGSAPYLFAVQPFKQIVVWKFTQKVGRTVTIEKVHFSWTGPQRIEGIHIVTDEIDGKIDQMSSTVPFWKIGSYVSGLEQISGSGTTHVNGQTGQFSIEVTRTELDAINLQLTASQMPTEKVLSLLKMDHAFLALIGPSFNAAGSFATEQDTGKCDLKLSSTNMQTSLQAEFTSSEITLLEPFTLACYLTPEITKKLTRGAVSLQSKTPARLRIEPKGFSCPRAFSLAKLRIPQASIDLGRALLLDADLSTLATLLNNDRLSANQIDLWFTNVDCKLQNGLFEMGRLDSLLADSIHLCAWGTVDLVKDKLNLIFGIPADTLAKSLRIQNVSSTFVLQVPITGSIEHPNVDATTATAKIAALLAANQVQKQGGVLGNVGRVIGKISEEKSPPPKRPFPWE